MAGRGRSIELPNGLILAEVGSPFAPRRDYLFASDGQTVLAEDVEFVCFNDRYVYATTRSASGVLFDGETNMQVPKASVRQAYETVQGRGGCKGYFTAMVGPELLYDRFHAALSCKHFNLDDPTLKDRSWFDRPCRPARRSRP